MKKALLPVFIFAAIISLLPSCKKQNSSTSGGSWIFHNQTFNASFCSYVLGALTASTENSTPIGSIAFYFPDTVATAGTYTVTNQYVFNPITNSLTIAPGYVFVQLTDTAIANEWIIKGSPNVQVTVTVSSTGYATVTMPPVMMVNANTTPPSPPGGPYIAPVGILTGTDSSLVSATIIQTPL